MYNVYVSDLIEKCNGKLLQGNLDFILENFSKDTRTIQSNDVYVGIKGEKLDGSIFYKDAIEKGASTCILNNTIKLDEEFLNKNTRIK